MEPADIQRKYLEIQHNLGALAAAAPETQRNKLNSLSIRLLEIKREWIGLFDEIDSEITLNEQLQRLPTGRSDNPGHAGKQPRKR